MYITCCFVLLCLQISADSRPLDVESLRRMHESVKRAYETVPRASSHMVGGALDYGSSSQSAYEPQAGGRSYSQPASSRKFSYPSSTSYSDNWPYTSESHKPSPSSQHIPEDLPTTHSDTAYYHTPATTPSDSAYYHTPSTFAEYPYATTAADIVASPSAVPAREDRNSSRHSYTTDYSDELTSQMSKLDVGGAHRSYQSTTIAGEYTSNSLSQSSSSSAFSASAVTTGHDSAPPQTSSQYGGAPSTSWYEGDSSSRYDSASSSLYDVTAGIQHSSGSGGYGSISSTPSSSGMTVTSGSGYPVVPTACSTTEQQLRERVRQLEQMVQQKDVTIEEQRSQLKYSGPQKLYQDPTLISPGPATLYSSGSLSSPHHSGLLQQAYGTPPSISPQATMQHVHYYSHTGAPAAGAGFYTPQPPPGYPSHRWSGPLSAPMTGGQYPSPPGSLPAQQTITPPGTHLVSVIHPHSGPILMPATATPTAPPPRQVCKK